MVLADMQNFAWRFRGDRASNHRSTHPRGAEVDNGLMSDIASFPKSATTEVSGYRSITSSAVASSIDGNVRPSVLAVLRLITSSNFVGCTTGSSEGFAPRRILPT